MLMVLSSVVKSHFYICKMSFFVGGLSPKTAYFREDLTERPLSFTNTHWQQMGKMLVLFPQLTPWNFKKAPVFL